MNQVKSQGASNTLFNHSRPNHPNRSKFDLSRLQNFSIDPGMIAPFDLFPTLPGDEAHIKFKFSLDTLPLIQSSLTGYKVITHWYYMKNRDLWKGWKTFITKGRTGNVNLTVPQVDLNYPIDKPKAGSLTINVASYNGEDDNDFTAYGYYYPIARHSLSSWLDIPSYYSGFYNFVSLDDGNPSSVVLDAISPVLYKDYLPYTFVPTNKNEWSEEMMTEYTNAIKTGFGNYSKVNALPFVMYQNIVKNNYVNQNLLQNNTALFPEQGDDDWLLPYTVDSGKSNIANYISGRSQIDNDDVINVDGIFSSDETDVDLRLLRYAQFDDDYFTTALPWLQRGDVSELGIDLTADINGSWQATGTTPVTLDGKGGVSLRLITDSETSDDTVRYSQGALNNSNYVAFTGHQNDSASGAELKFSSGGLLYNASGSLVINNSAIAQALTLGSSSKKVSISLTANQFRQLLALSVWQERNARVDGSYNAMIFQHWQKNPKSEEHKPMYIGGTCDYINFSTVIQNSQSSSDSKLGDTAGFGSVAGVGDVGTFHCDDYGFIMGIMIIKPITTYQQGVPHWAFETSFDDYVQPEFESLSPQPILNKELYVQGTDNDNQLFGYQERYTYLKVRQNVNKGMFAVKPGKDILFGAFTQSRWFENKPELSYQFLCMSPGNIRRDWLAYPVYPTFRVQALTDCFVVRELAYTSQPNTFGF